MERGQRAATVKFLIRDRAGQFTSSFDAVLAAGDIKIVASPPQAPNANAICEDDRSWSYFRTRIMIGALRREVPDRLLVLSEQHLRQVLAEYLRHDNTARPHRALGQLTPAQAGTCPPEPVDLAQYRIRRKQVLSALTHDYYVAA
jgi:putative transposase